MTTSGPHRDVYFEMSFCPSLDLVSVVRRFVGAFYERVLTDTDLAGRVALAAHELLENAVKYSVDGETYIRMDVLEHEVVIRTRNRANPDHVRIVRDRLEALRASGDADGFYHALIRDSARAPQQRGGLGLGRIASEAGMELSMVVDANGLVELTARTVEMPA
jgi:hypothetical protein